MKHRVCVVTGTRAEYGLLSGLMRQIADDPELELQIVATGTHLVRSFGMTLQHIERDGFSINRKVRIPVGDSETDAISSMAAAMRGLSRAYGELKPHIVVLLGDRTETFAAAATAVACRVPIAHIHGGETTLGAIDDVCRHAITKMSHLHFAAAEPYRRRIIQMGESPARVWCAGALGLEAARRVPLMSLEQLEDSLGLVFRRPAFLVTYHPVTLEEHSSAQHARELLAALDAFPKAGIIFTQANMDPGHQALNDAVSAYARRHAERAIFVPNLGQVRYLSALRCVDVVIGNSSSGLIEAPAFGLPTVNVGDRQKGRLMADSVICCPCSRQEIRAAIARALSPATRRRLSGVRNPYGDGTSTSVQILRAIKRSLKKGIVLGKPFHDLPPMTSKVQRRRRAV